MWMVENEVFGFHHGEVGSLVAARWKLPRSIVAAIRFHHGPPDRVHGVSDVLLVTSADRIAGSVAKREPPAPEEVLNRATRHRLALTQDMLLDILEQAAASWPEIQV